MRLSNGNGAALLVFFFALRVAVPGVLKRRRKLKSLFNPFFGEGDGISEAHFVSDDDQEDYKPLRVLFSFFFLYVRWSLLCGTCTSS